MYQMPIWFTPQHPATNWSQALHVPSKNCAVLMDVDYVDYVDFTETGLGQHQTMRDWLDGHPEQDDFYTSRSWHVHAILSLSTHPSTPLFSDFRGPDDRVPLSRDPQMREATQKNFLQSHVVLIENYRFATPLSVQNTSHRTRLPQSKIQETLNICLWNPSMCPKAENWDPETANQKMLTHLYYNTRTRVFPLPLDSWQAESHGGSRISWFALTAC